MANKVSWLNYDFEVCKHNDAWKEVGGVYIFCGLSQQNRWVALYIGKADSLRNRIPSHEQWNPAVRLGATHVHAMVVQQSATRGTIEEQLIQAYQPTLNVQLKS